MRSPRVLAVALALHLAACAEREPAVPPHLEAVSLPAEMEAQDVPVRRQFERAYSLVVGVEETPDSPPAARAEAHGRLGALLLTYGYSDLAAGAYRNATLLVPGRQESNR